jgi:hypothetical protein
MPSAAAPQQGMAHRTWPWALLLGLIGAAIAWVRMPGRVAGQLYAEDGRTFIGDWLTHGGWSLWIEPYAGYQHFLPRTIAWFTTTLLPVSWWAAAVNVAACLVVGAVVGLVFVFSRDVVTFVPARVTLALLVVLTPVVGFEALGNLANLHWFLLYLSLWVVLATPRSTAGAVAMAFVALLCTATEPQCAIFLPLVIWRVIQSRRTWVVAAGWLIGVAAQVATTLIAPRAVATDYPPAVSTLEGYVLNVGMTLGSNRADVLGWVLRNIGWWVGFLGVAVIVGIAVLGMVRSGLNAAVAIAALLYGSVVSWTASFVLGSNPDYFYSDMTIEQIGNLPLLRWATAASMMLAATIPVTIGGLIDRYERWKAAGGGLLAVLLVIMSISVRTTDAVEPSSWELTAEQAEAQCALEPDAVIRLATPPDPTWVVSVPCSLISD